MPRTCASCSHPSVGEINRRIRAGSPLTDISRWLSESETPITAIALARHAKGHLGVPTKKGRRPVSGDFLEAVRDSAHQGLEDGSLTVTLRDGLQAQKQIDERASRMADRDLMARIAMMMTGQIVEGTAREVDPDLAELEAEFRPLLTASTARDVLD